MTAAFLRKDAIEYEKGRNIVLLIATSSSDHSLQKITYKSYATLTK